MSTNHFDQFDGPSRAANYFDKFDDTPKPKRSLVSAINDNVIEAANAAAGTASAVANFVRPGNALSDYIDKNIIEAGNAKQSDVVKAEKARYAQEMEQAQGFGDEVSATLGHVARNPLLAAAQAAGSFAGPGLAVGGARAAAGALGMGAKAATRTGLAAGAGFGMASAGGDAAGTAYELSRQGGATDEQALAAARGASVIPGAWGAVGGLVGAERLVAGAKGFTGGLAARALKTGAVEGAQEALEEGVTQYEGQRAAVPFNPDLDPTKGVAGAATMGAVLGGMTGGGASLLTGQNQPARKPSEDLGLNPDSGPISKVAAAAVDEGRAAAPMQPAQPAQPDDGLSLAPEEQAQPQGPTMAERLAALPEQARAQADQLLREIANERVPVGVKRFRANELQQVLDAYPVPEKTDTFNPEESAVIGPIVRGYDPATGEAPGRPLELEGERYQNGIDFATDEQPSQSAYQDAINRIALESYQTPGQPLAMEQAGRLRDAAREQGIPATIVPHPSGRGFDVQATAVLPEAARQQVAQDPVAAALPYDNSPTGRMVADAQGNARSELRPEAVEREVRWSQELAQMDAEARRRAELGLSNRTPVTPLQDDAAPQTQSQGQLTPQGGRQPAVKQQPQEVRFQASTGRDVVMRNAPGLENAPIDVEASEVSPNPALGMTRRLSYGSDGQNLEQGQGTTAQPGPGRAGTQQQTPPALPGPSNLRERIEAFRQKQAGAARMAQQVGQAPGTAAALPAPAADAKQVAASAQPVSTSALNDAENVSSQALAAIETEGTASPAANLRERLERFRQKRAEASAAVQQPMPPENGTSLAGAQITARQAQQAGAKARQQAKQAQRQAERAQAAPEETGLRVGVAPGSADPVTVRDGVVHIGEYEAVNYDSGEPVTVPKGSTRADVARALKDAGVLSSRQKMFGLSEKAQEVMFSRSAMKSTEANIARGRESLAKALNEKTTVHRAMFRNGLGWVDFVWGSEGTVKPSGRTKGAMGLAHVLEARQRKDGYSRSEAVEFLNSILDTIARGSEFDRKEIAQSTRVGLIHQETIVWLSRHKGSNAWVVTGYEKTPSGTAAGRATAVPTHDAASLTRSTGEGVAPIMGEQHVISNPVGFSRSAETKVAYESRIDALFAGEKPALDGVRVLDSSDMLGLLGMGNGPVHLAEGKVNASKHPNMTAQEWKKIPQWLDNPAAVFDSATVSGRLVLVAPETVNNAPVLMVVEPNGQKKTDGVRVHLLQNAYDKDESAPPFGRWLQDGKGRYVSQKEFPAVLNASGLQLSSTAWQNKPGMGRILTEKHLAGYRKANSTDILYSKSAKPVTNPTAVKLRRAMVQRTVDALAKGWAKAPNVTVVDSMQDERVPEAVRKADAAQRSQGAMGEPEGFWYRGQVYLVASALPTSADAARVLYHEVLGHHGLRGHFGKDLDRVLDQVIKLRRNDVQAKAQEYGLDMDNPKHAGYAAEEVLAELAQSRPDLGFVQRAIAAIRNFLRTHVPGFKVLELTDADIVQGYLLPARGWVERGGVRGAVNGDTRFSFAGERANTADTMALATAQQRLDAGEDAEIVRQETGWHKGADDKWRFEISDADAKYIGKDAMEQAAENDPYKMAEMRLEEVLDHPALFAAYPGLRDVSVAYEASSAADGDLYYGASYNAQDNVITIGNGLDEGTQLSALLHEIQHGIQHIEGFATGGTQNFAAGLIGEARANQDELRQKRNIEWTRLGEEAERLVRNQPDSDFVRNAIKKWRGQLGERSDTNPFGVTDTQAVLFELEESDLIYPRLAKRLFGIEQLAAIDDPRTAYLRLAGEVEARNTQARQNMTAEERRATPPRATQDVADFQVIVTFNGKQSASAPAPANAGVRFSRSGSPDAEVQRQFKETERAYGGKAAYDRAKAAGKTKLTHGQWVQVRTPNFKAWFGDWEAVRAQERLDAMEPVQVRVPDAWRGLGHAELRQKMAEELDRMVREKVEINHPELGMIQVGRAGAKKTGGSARDPAKSLVAADIELLIPASIYARTEPSRGGDGPDIEGYSTLLARVDVDGVPLVAAFTVRHQSDGQWYYNAVALHDGKEKAQDSYGRPDQQAGSSVAPIAGLSDFIRRPLARVNPEAVSKVVDSATGEPLVVYHGTGADFSVFDGKKRGSHTREVDARKGFFLSSSPEIASEYAEEAGANGGANIMPAYVSLQNPLVIDEGGRDYDAERFRDYIDQAQEQGHDGVLLRNTGDGMFKNGRTGDTVIAFRSEQIKSATGNNGNFDATSPDIRFSRSQSSDAIRSSMGQMTPDQEAAWKKVAGLEKVPTLRERWESLKANLGTRMKQALVDQFAPIAELDQHAYMLARMSKGSDGTLEAALLYGRPFLRDGVPDVDVKEGGFAKVLAGLKGEQDRFLMWVAAQRAENLKAQGKENLFSDQDISSLKTLNDGQMQDGSSRKQAYAKALMQLNSFNESVLRMAKESGLIDQAAYDLMKDQPYVPFYRLMEDEGGLQGPTFSKGLTNQKAWKKLKGGTQQLNADLLQNMLLNWGNLYAASARNRAALATMDAAEKMAIAYKVPSDTKGAAKVMRDGVTEYWMVEDPYLLEAISALNYQASPLMKPLAAAKKWLTLGVTVNPTFKVRNLIRDVVSSMAMADLSYNPAANISKGWKLTARDSQVYASMLASGGVIRFGTQEQTDRARRQVAKLSGVVLDQAAGKKLWGQLKALYEIYDDFGDRTENINRAALYDRLIQKGHSHAEASFMARDLMDFSMSGSAPVVRFLTQSVPFLNARMQGLYKLGRAAKEDPRRFATVAMAVSMASLGLLAAYADDEDWKRREDWDRDSYWWFKIGQTAYRIPKPFEVGTIGTLAERTAEAMFDDEMDSKRFMERISHMVSQTFAFDPIPQAVKPLLDIYANKDSFTGRAIESMADQRLRPQDRYNEKTSEVARLLGQMGLPDPAQLVKGEYVSLSPKQIDHLLRGYFSWMATAAITTSDALLRHTVVDRGEAPDLRLKDMLLVGNFAESLPAGGSRYVTALYEQSRAIEQAYASYQDALKSGERDKAAEIMESDGDKIRSRGSVAAATKLLSQLNAQAKRVQEDREMSGEEKRARLTQLEQRRHEIAKRVMGG